jgi:hypothetical protein
LLDGEESLGAVVSHSGQQNANGAPPCTLGYREEQLVRGGSVECGGVRIQLKPRVCAQAQMDASWCDVYAPGAGVLPMFGKLDGKSGLPCHPLDQAGREIEVEMLNDKHAFFMSIQHTTVLTLSHCLCA